MKHRLCRCRDCRGQKRKGKILGSRLLRHLGSNAYYVSAYVISPKYAKGVRARKRNQRSKVSASTYTA